jgi:sulfate adenylyltransferase
MISPHGGKLINQCWPERKRRSYANIPAIPMSAIAASDLWNIATGVFSPLTGFMDEKALTTVLRENRIESLAWTIPITLDVPEKVAERIRPGEEVGLTDPQGVLQGVIQVSEVSPHRKDERCLGTFGTLDPLHPGVATVQAMGSYLIAGTVWTFSTGERESEAWALTPAATRQCFEKKGWKTVTGFQTRNVPHRAHEYLQRCALEYTDGLFIQPIRGWVKAGDFDPEIVQLTYRLFITELYPADRVHLGSLSTAMRYAGPKEAVFHATIRQNFGCTHFIVGRDHAGVGRFYETYAAHEIFDNLPSLDISILRFFEPFFCKRCEVIATDKTCGHDEPQRTYINGSDVRDMLAARRPIPSHVMREDMVRFLRELQESRPLFSEGTQA